MNGMGENAHDAKKKKNTLYGKGNSQYSVWISIQNKGIMQNIQEETFAETILPIFLQKSSIKLQRQVNIIRA